MTTAGGGDPRTATGNETAVLTRSSLLLDLEKKPLLKVFVFLNAGEVLRAAQVCRPMFRKVREQPQCTLISGWKGDEGMNWR